MNRPNKAKLQVWIGGYHQPSVSTSTTISVLPAFAWPTNQLNKVVDQGNCGSCYAISNAQVLSDQISLKTSVPINLSPMPLLRNIPQDNCTDGGYPLDAASYDVKVGLPLWSKWPYTCDGCDSSTAPSSLGTLYKVNGNTLRSGLVTYQPLSKPSDLTDLKQINVPLTIRLIQQWIQRVGPVVTGIAVPADLPNWQPTSSKPIYQMPSQPNFQGGHAISLVGWGYDSANRLFWQIRNSWGTSWGEQGYFKAYAYPLNNFGLDIPLLSNDSKNPGPWGGVLLFEPLQ